MSAPSEKGQILVVDDAEDNRIILSRFLTAGGYSVSDAVDGVDALSRLADWRPDLVLLDWMMPNLSGIEVLRSVRDRYSASQLPVIMCTAREEADSIADALDAGANDYVTKPINRNILLARVKAQLERKQALDALSTITGDLERALAERTRTLIEVHSARPADTDALNELLRLAEWLQSSPDAGDLELRSACASSISNAARRRAAC
jgi:DNA-binding response OmpR family regulator